MQKTKDKLFNIIFYAIFIVLLVFALLLVFPQYNKYKDKIRAVHALKADLSERHNECMELIEVVNRLETDPAMIEKIAREKYKLCKDNEIILSTKR